MTNLEGETLGRYRLGYLIGEGGMADVYMSYDLSRECEVAVKVFKGKEEKMLLRFMREAEIMRSLNNEHLVPIYDSGSCKIGNDSRYYIVMPFMKGRTLQTDIDFEPLSLKDACEALGDIADALQYLHNRGIIHRDIKALNVLLDGDGRCYLADYGIAHVKNDKMRLTSSGNVPGTLSAIAPELFEAGREADVGSDLYSLGVLLFEMVTGELPHFNQDLAALLKEHHVPEPAVRVILRSLEKKPERRYRTATEMASAFCQAISSSTIQSPLTLPLLPVGDGSPDGPILPSALTSVVRLVSIPPVNTPPQRKIPRNLWVTFAAFIAVLFVIVAVPIVGRAVKNDSLSSNNVTATAQSLVSETAQAHVAATEMVQAQETATAGVLPTATSIPPLYNDPLNDASNARTVAIQWDGVDGNDSQCNFQTDGYHVIQSDTGNQHACQELTYSYGNATITVNVTILSGHSGGIFLRFSKGVLDTYNGYMFEIDSGGDYKFSSFAGKTLQDWTPSPHLRIGYNVANKLAVIMSGNTFELYANGGYLTSLMDSSNQFASGNIALFAVATDAVTEVVFSNLTVYPST